MEHTYSVSSVTRVLEKGDFEKVASGATITVTSSETFDYTYEKSDVLYNDGVQEIVTETVTEPRTIENSTYFTVDFDTDTLDPLMFTAWEDLTEDQVLQWAQTSNADKFSEVEQENVNIITDKKDRLLYPKRYVVETPPSPWRVRSEQQLGSN